MFHAGSASKRYDSSKCGVRQSTSSLQKFLIFLSFNSLKKLIFVTLTSSTSMTADMVSTKSGKKVSIDVPTPPLPPAMLGEEANLGLVCIDLGASTKNEESWLTEGDDDEVTHVLQLHQIAVGKDTAKGEEQIIEAEFAISGTKKAVTPIAFLTRGQCNLLQTDIRLPAGTVFRLVEGKGPVHILGSHVVSPTPEEDVIESDMEDEDDEDDMPVAEEDEKVSSKKRKASGEGENDSKKIKNGASSGDETVPEEAA